MDVGYLECKGRLKMTVDPVLLIFFPCTVREVPGKNWSVSFQTVDIVGFKKQCLFERKSLVIF